MYIFLYSPYGNKIECFGSPSIWKVLTANLNTNHGTWYYGPLENMPRDVFQQSGWLLGYQELWGNPKYQTELKTRLSVMAIVECYSLDSLNGIRKAVEHQTPIILVPRGWGSEKTSLFRHLGSLGYRPLGLIDTDFQQVQYIIHAGFHGIYFNEKITTVYQYGMPITRNSQEILIETQNN